CYHPHSGGGAGVTFKTTTNNTRPRTRPNGPPAGGNVSDFFNAVAGQNGWYDFTVTVNSDSSWSQRFSGHLETGAASVTG
ncbi:phospholipase domain-containing protein, partial [Kitasatospora indigofera]|uniref:phospholipase domain-containing protein n=1 Tax=Kitasatospora indigofera TaxID=67307 RepID=UPI00366099BB